MIKKLFLAIIILMALTSPIWSDSSTSYSIFKDDEGKLSLKTSSMSSFTHHTNHMEHNNYNFQYIKDKTKARAGKYFQRFELRDGDCFADKHWNDCKNNRERVEFSAEPHQRPVKNQCYGYSLMLSKDFIDTHPTNTSLGQVHQIGGPTGIAGGLSSFPPLIQIDARLGSLYFNWHKLSGSKINVIDRSYYYELKKLRYMKEVWTDISFCLDFENERMDVWVDGVQKVKILKSPIFFKPKEIYFKYGIYRSFISKYKEGKNRKMPKQIVFYDEIRRGNSIEKVDININPKLKTVD